jgi:cytochrome c-type biogenesis protein CcmH/NrfG
MPRRFRIVALAFWPGLAQIWLGQEVLGLLLGLFFALTVNLAIISRWIWTAAFAPGWPKFLGALAALAWAASFLFTAWWVALCHPDRHRREIDRLFREAHEWYLLGRWSEAKRRLEQILARDEGDADALMQLGTIYLRTEQPALARRAFHQCLQSGDGAKWKWEIQEALKRIDDQSAPSSS